jgi:hypothetical protein
MVHHRYGFSLSLTFRRSHTDAIAQLTIGLFGSPCTVVADTKLTTPHRFWLTRLSGPPARIEIQNSLHRGWSPIFGTPGQIGIGEKTLLHNAFLQRAFSAYPRHEIIASLKTVYLPNR